MLVVLFLNEFCKIRFCGRKYTSFPCSINLDSLSCVVGWIASEMDIFLNMMNYNSMARRRELGR